MVENPNELISSVSNSRVMVFSPNFVLRAKNYYYELVFGQSDVSLYKNPKKIDYL
jgi:hypothetical protein